MISPIDSSYIRELDDGGVSLGGDAVVGEEGIQQWTEHTALGSPCAQCPGAGYSGTSSSCLGSVCEKVQDPAAEGGCQCEVVEFFSQSAGADGVKAGL